MSPEQLTLKVSCEEARPAQKTELSHVVGAVVLVVGLFVLFVWIGYRSGAEDGEER